MSASGSAPLPFGVNIAGYITSEKGLGEAVRANIRSAEAAGVPRALINFKDDAPNKDEAYSEFSSDNPYAVNLIQANMTGDRRFAKEKGPSFFSGRYNIGFWYWELPDFPKEWMPSFQFHDEIWAGSEFAKASIERVSPVPVHKLLPSLPPLKAEGGSRDQLGIPRDAFVFLFSFDFNSCLHRKNPLGLARAFKLAFGGDERVLLVLKASHSGAFRQDLASIQAAADGARLRVIDSVMKRSEFEALLASCDSYVSLHRSEGFGLPMAEAMALGKPVIATGYSGNMDFMSDQTAFLVRHSIAATGTHPHRCPYKDSTWAEPDIEHAASLMRTVFEDRRRARETAERGRRFVRELLEPSRLGRLMAERLSAITAGRPPERLRQSSIGIP